MPQPALVSGANKLSCVAWVSAPPRCPFLGNTRQFFCAYLALVLAAYGQDSVQLAHQIGGLKPVFYRSSRMKRDTLRTLGGVVVICLIVVATFMYGNSQRQAQIRHDQDVKAQQEAKASTTPQASPTAAPSNSPAVASNGTSNTAPVNTPSSNSIQGSGASPSASPKPSSSPTPSSSPQVAVTTPDTGGSAAMPQTGPAADGLLAIAAITAVGMAYTRSRRAVLQAARSRR